jgi:hypothetical protein
MDEELERHLSDLIEREAVHAARAAAVKTLVGVCLELLQDHPRFAEVLSAAVNHKTGLLLNRPISNEKAVSAFTETVVTSVPSQYRELIAGR